MWMHVHLSMRQNFISDTLMCEKKHGWRRLARAIEYEGKIESNGEEIAEMRARGPDVK